METSIYAIAAISASEGRPEKIECIKIGVSNDPRKRLETLQTGNHRPLKLLFSAKLERSSWAYEMEKAAHEALAAYNTSGEWFAVTDRKVITFIKKLFSIFPKQESSFYGPSFYDEGAL